MKHRKLRIAWSVTWGIAAVLLIALWVRSYRLNEVQVFKLYGIRFQVASLLGRIDFGAASNAVSFRQPVTDGLRAIAHSRENRLGFEYYRQLPTGPGEYLISFKMPDWFLLTIVTSLAAIPWAGVHCRFSLRSLLIGMTLVAALLGVGIWLR
jgi:hypothetical protein